MTSWQCPDYSITLKVAEISSCDLVELSGNCFTISLLRADIKRAVQGMIMLQGDYPDKPKEIQAHLWIFSKIAIIPIAQQVRVILNEECDPMYHSGSEKDEVKKLLPLQLQGEIYEIKSVSDEELLNLKKMLQKGSECS